MKFAITGASGLIGKALSLKLAKEGHEVIAIHRSPTPSEFDSFTQIQSARGDIQDLAFLQNAFESVDGVFHVAAFAKPWVKDESIYFTINETGTRNVCQAALNRGVKRVVYTSSAGTHGAQFGNDLITESNWPKHYDTAYEQSKFNARNVALSFIEKGLEVTVVSPARVYGPPDFSESNVPYRMIKIYMEKKVGIVPADGTGIGSYVYIDDVVNGHIIAMLKAPSGEEFLLGGDNRSYLAFFQALRTVSNTSYPILKIPYPISLAIGKSQLFAAEHFGLTPTITTPWVRKYLKNWGISSEKIKPFGYNITSLEAGMALVLGHEM